MLFGPRHHVSQEAQDLLAGGGGLEVSDAATARAALREVVLDDIGHARRGGASRALVASRTGTTERLLCRVLSTLG